MQASPRRFEAYGWTWESELDLSYFTPAPVTSRRPDITVTLCQGPPPHRVTVFDNGRISIADDGLRMIDQLIATMDTVGAGQINIYPGADWRGILPPSFFGTMTGALMAIRGGLTIHGSAVEWQGKALILCGHAGAGKSTASAALIARGAKLISDDLTVVRAAAPGRGPVVYPGRRCVRLYPGKASELRATVTFQNLPAAGPKELATPPFVASSAPLPLSRIILIGTQAETYAAVSEYKLFVSLLYRPRIFRLLNGQTFRTLALRQVLSQVGLSTCPPFENLQALSLESVAEKILGCWQAAL